MNKTMILAGLILILGLLAAPAMAGNFDGKQNLICATVDVVECAPGGQCNQLVAEEVDFPDFFRIDFKEKKMGTQQSGHDKRSTDIERIEEIEGKLILQGAEDGLEGVRDGLGWSLAIDQDDGRMVLTGSGSGVAFVIFGACTVP